MINPNNIKNINSNVAKICAITKKVVNKIHNNNLNNALNNNNINQRSRPMGFFKRISNRIGVPIVPIGHPLPHNHNYFQKARNTFKRKKTLSNLVALQNDDLLAISNKDCWILRNNSIKYVIYKDQIINCERILDIKKALPISNNEFVIEISIFQNNN